MSLCRFKFNLGLLPFTLVFFFFLITCAVYLELAGTQWDQIVDEIGYSPVSSQYWFGTNYNGQDIFARTLVSTKTAFEVGLIVAFFSIFIGTLLGALAGYKHGEWLDTVITWSFACIDAIPFYLFAACVALIFKDGKWGMHLSMIACLWTSSCKSLRSQVMILKSEEYITATRALGASDARILFLHILPNTLPLILVEFTLCFVIAIKTEAVFSFLGLAGKDGVSWGLMLSEASTEIHAGKFNNFLAAASCMFLLIFALNQCADTIQDAFDPHRSTASMSLRRWSQKFRKFCTQVWVR